MWLHHVSGEAADQDVFHYHVHLTQRPGGLLVAGNPANALNATNSA